MKLLRYSIFLFLAVILTGCSSKGGKEGKVFSNEYIFKDFYNSNLAALETTIRNKDQTREFEVLNSIEQSHSNENLIKTKSLQEFVIERRSEFYNKHAEYIGQADKVKKGIYMKIFQEKLTF